MNERDILLEQLKDLVQAIIYVLCNTLEENDKETFEHSKRVSLYSSIIAGEYGFDDEAVSNIQLAGLLHDIGKISIPLKILKKPDLLTDTEFDVIKNHPANAIKLLEHIKPLENITHWIVCNHERYDGKGYPEGLSGEQIPIEASIIFIADTYDSMTYDTPYRKGIDHASAVQEIQACSGTQFNPAAVEAFLKAERGFEVILMSNNSNDSN